MYIVSMENNLKFTIMPDDEYKDLFNELCRIENQPHIPQQYNSINLSTGEIVGSELPKSIAITITKKNHSNYLDLEERNN